MLCEFLPLGRVNMKTGPTRELPWANFFEPLFIVLCVLQFPVSFILEDAYIMNSNLSSFLYNAQRNRMYLVPLLVIVAVGLFGIRWSTKYPSFRKKFFWRIAVVSLVIFGLCHDTNQSFHN